MPVINHELRVVLFHIKLRNILFLYSLIYDNLTKPISYLTPLALRSDYYFIKPLALACQGGCMYQTCDGLYSFRFFIPYPFPPR